MAEGMEALLDFPEFSSEAAGAPLAFPAEDGKETPSVLDIPASALPKESSKTSPEPVKVSDSTPETTSVEPISQKKRKEESSSPKDANSPSIAQRSVSDVLPSNGEPPVKKVKKLKKIKEDGASTSQADETEDEEIDELLDGEDFEGDLLDLVVPQKEEDPEDVAERQKLQLLISHLSEEQLNRYEVYRRASFPKAAVRRIVQTVGGCTISQNAVIAMAGIAKMHVGEIVETALDVKTEWAESGPLQPKHLREAARRMRNRTNAPSKYRKKTQTQPYP